MEGCASKNQHPQAGKALQAIELGLIGRVGQVNGQRVTLLTHVLRGDLTDASSASLTSRLLKCVATTLAADEVAVLDAVFKVKAVQDAGISRFVARLSALTGTDPPGQHAAHLFRSDFRLCADRLLEPRPPSPQLGGSVGR